MKKALHLLRYFSSDERGATAIEYSLIAMLVALPTIAAFELLGHNISTSIMNVAAGFK